MATLGRIASGSGDSALLRAADVFLKERRKLILVPRETPWSLIHARNVVTLPEAGAIVLPAVPSFYSRPKSVVDVVDTVVWRILDQIGLPNSKAFRWREKLVCCQRRNSLLAWVRGSFDCLSRLCVSVSMIRPASSVDHLNRG